MDITSLEQRAIDFARRGDFGVEAKQVNEELTKLAPSNQGAWTRLARCNIELGLFDAANAALEQALQLNPQNMIARSLLQESIRREVRQVPEPPTKRTRSTKARSSEPAAPRGGFGRAQFAALQQLAPASALESLGPTIEALLMALNERPFAAKVVEARNRAGQSGSKLFRRNSFYAGTAGHLYAFHHGGRWEPQINLGFFAVPEWGKSAIRAGIGFNLSASGADPEREAGQERVAAYYEDFQRLIGSEWKALLTDWMSANRGFIQYADRQPAVDLLPRDAVEWLVANRNAVEQGWVFVGRWLFSDQAAEAETMENPAQLVKWIDETFTDLLPLWSSTYRGL